MPNKNAHRGDGVVRIDLQLEQKSLYEKKPDYDNLE